MNRTVVTLLITLLAAPALAGCLGGDDVEPDDAGECTDCEVGSKIKEGMGGVKGQIADDALSPLVGANVTIRLGPGESKTAVTDSQGKYQISNVPPGTYSVYAQNPPTHRAKAEEVEVVANELTPLDLILAALPPPPKPYSTEVEFVGLIGCSVAFDPIRGSDRCQDIDENTQTKFVWPVDAYINALFVLIESKGAGAVGEQELAMTFERPANLEDIVGPLPLEKRYDITEENAWPTWGEPGEFRADLRASHQAGTPQFAFQQKVDVFFGMFYNGKVPPDGYSPKGGGE